MSDDRQEPCHGRTPETRSRGVPRPNGRPPESTEEPAGPRSRSAAWSGRAEVPPPRLGDSESPGEWYVEELGDRRWWMPIVVATVALALLAVLGTGLWLVVRPDAQRPSPAPLPSSDAVPTSELPTSAATGSSAAVRLPLPELVGMPRAAAEAELDRLGLGYRSQLRRSDRPAGTVVGTEPGAGELVPVGTDVVLIVSEGAAASGPTGGRTPTDG